eukprot:8438027-Pyramimonas_sp.AAC.1
MCHHRLSDDNKLNHRRKIAAPRLSIRNNRRPSRPDTDHPMNSPNIYVYWAKKVRWILNFWTGWLGGMDRDTLGHKGWWRGGAAVCSSVNRIKCVIIVCQMTIN